MTAAVTPTSGPPPISRRGYRRGVLGPVILIAGGSFLLAGNLGYLGSFSFFHLIKLWPLLLVLAGIDLAIGRRLPLLALVIDILVLGGAFAFVAAQSGAVLGARQDQGGDARISVPRNAVRSLDLHIAGSAARYTVSGGATDLVEATSDRSDLRLVGDRRSGETAAVRLEQRNEPFVFDGGRGNVDVRIASDVNLTLRFDAGAGDFTVDLRDLKVKEVRMAIGAAAMRLILPKPDGDVPVRIEAGASSITIEAAEGVEARVNTSGLVSTRITSSRFSSRGNDAESAGYSSARDRVTVTISAGASSVTVR